MQATTPLEDLARAHREYEALLGGDESEPRLTTYGARLKPLYTPLDTAGLDYLSDLGFPGGFPFTRGATPTGYRGKGWTRRQVIGVGTAEETNERLRYLFDQGQTGFSVCGMGYAPYESSDPRAEGVLGRGGVWLDTLADMETLLAGIDMAGVTINQIGASLPVFAMILAEADRRGIPRAHLSGTIQNVAAPGGDGPARRGNHTIDVIEFCTREMPRWNHTSISARNIRDQGVSSVQEVAFGVFMGLYTARAALSRGLDINAVAPRISFFFSAENEFLEEVAKFRAARRVWARAMRGLGATNPRAQVMRFHVQTSALSLTMQQPLNNIIRATIHALAAALGGAQSLSVNSYDEVLAIPTEAAATLSLRTQQIIADETDVTAVNDPLGGSYAIEALTQQIEDEVLKEVARLESYPDRQAFESMSADADLAGYRRQLQIDRGQRAMVGVNEHVLDEEAEEEIGLSANEIFEYDPAWRQKQMARLAKVKEERNPAAVEAARARLVQAYRDRENMVEPVVEAVKAYLSIGEITSLLASVAGWEELERRHCFYINQFY